MSSRDIARRLARLEEQNGGIRMRTIHLLDYWLTDEEAEAEKERLLRSGEASPDAHFLRRRIVDEKGRPIDMSHMRPTP